MREVRGQSAGLPDRQGARAVRRLALAAIAASSLTVSGVVGIQASHAAPQIGTSHITASPTVGTVPIPTSAARPRTRIVKVRLRQEGVHVYLRVYYSGPVSGFGFKGIKGSGWAEENHRLSSPSYGRVGKGWIEYPFNHLCGKSGQYQSDVLFWLINRYQNPAARVAVHLRCSPSGGKGHQQPPRKPDKMLPERPNRPRTTIDKVTLRRDGVLVYVRVYFSGPVPGFGFKGINGSRWAEENHSIDSPSYGKFGPGWVEYPFNHACGKPEQYESDIEFWLDNPYQARQARAFVHLSCGKAPEKGVQPGKPDPGSTPKDQNPGPKTPRGDEDPPWFTLGPGPR